jgi:hypothetical protein
MKQFRLGENKTSTKNVGNTYEITPIKLDYIIKVSSLFILLQYVWQLCEAKFYKIQ